MIALCDHRNAWAAVNFLVLGPGAAAPRPPVTVGGAVRAFGRPARVYQFQRYTILVWDENILSRLPRGRRIGG